MFSTFTRDPDSFLPPPPASSCPTPFASFIRVSQRIPEYSTKHCIRQTFHVFLPLPISSSYVCSSLYFTCCLNPTQLTWLLVHKCLHCNLTLVKVKEKKVIHGFLIHHALCSTLPLCFSSMWVCKMSTFTRSHTIPCCSIWKREEMCQICSLKLKMQDRIIRRDRRQERTPVLLISS